MQDVKKPNSTTTENQSAVDFLINQWLYLDTEFEMRLMDKNTYWEELRKVQFKAKEMELEQRKEDFRRGWHGKHKDFNCEFYLTKYLTNDFKK